MKVKGIIIEVNQIPPNVASVEQIIRFETEKDLYELDRNQDRPDNPYTEEWNGQNDTENKEEYIYKLAQQEMFKAGWRKIIL